MATTLKQTLMDPLYRNWVTSGLILKCTKDGIQHFVDAKVDTFHKKLLTDSRQARGLPAGMVRTICTTKNMLDKRYKCPTSGLCEEIRDRIIQSHRYGNTRSGPSWNNTDAQQWCGNHWEVAKCYMAVSGYTSIQSAADTDFPGLLCAVINLTDFQTDVTENLDKSNPNNLFCQARTIRNDVLHTSTFQLARPELDDYIDVMITLLSNPPNLAADTHAQDAIRKLNEIKNGTLVVTDVDERMIQLEASRFIQAIQAEGSKTKDEVLHDIKAEGSKKKDEVLLDLDKEGTEKKHALLQDLQAEGSEKKDALLQDLEAEGSEKKYAILQYLQAEGIEKKDAILQYLQAEGSEKKDALLQDLQAEGSEKKDVILQYLQAEGSEKKNAILQYLQAEGNEKKDVILQDLQADGSEKKDVILQDLQAEGSEKKDALLQDLQAEGSEKKNLILQDLQAEGSEKKDAILQDLQAEGSEKKDAILQDLQAVGGERQDALLQDLQAEGSEKKDAILQDLQVEGSKMKDEVIKVVTKMTKRKLKAIEEKTEHSTKKAKRDLTTTTKRKLKVLHIATKHCSKRVHLESQKQKAGLAKETEEAYMKEKNEMQTDLVNLYMGSYIKTPVTPLTPDDDAPIEDIYVKPCMTQVNLQQYSNRDKKLQKAKRDNATERSVDSYKDIFYKDSQQCKKIYITGDAGTGKTTLCKKMILNWCKAHSNHALTDPLSEDEQVMLSFQLLFYISLRNAASDSDIDNMIKNQLVQDTIRHPLMSNMLQKESEKCLILLDGLDEWAPPAGYRQNSPVVSEGLPNRNISSKWTTVTTSRPWKLEVLRLKTSEIDQQIELKGIDSQSAKTLIESVIEVLNTNQGRDMDSKKFRRMLRKSKLEQFLSIPVILKQLIALWHEGKPLGSSQCDIYSSMIDLMFELAEKRLADTPELKQLKEEWSEKSIIQFPKCFEAKPECEQYKHLLYSLGRLSFKTLFSENPESSLVFKNKVAEIHGLSKTEIEVSLKTGILSQSKIKGYSSQMKSLSFLHKTFQEFLAAMFVSISSDTSDEFVKSICTTCNSVEKVFEMGNLFKFISGMSPQTATKISEHICAEASKAQYPSEEIQDLVVDCVKEGLDNGYMDIKLKLDYITVSARSPYDPDTDPITSNSDDAYTSALKHLIGTNLGNITALYMNYYTDFLDDTFIESLLKELSLSLLTSVETLKIHCESVDIVLLLDLMDNLRNTLTHLKIDCRHTTEGPSILEQPISNLKSLVLSGYIISGLVEGLVDGATKLTDLRMGYPFDYYSKQYLSIDDHYDYDYCESNLINIDQYYSDTDNIDLDLSQHDQLQYFIVERMRNTTVTITTLNTTNLVQCEISNCHDVALLLKCLSGAPKLETLRIDNSCIGYIPSEELSTMAPMNNMKTVTLIDAVTPSQIQRLLGCATQIINLHLVYTDGENYTVNIALDLSHHEQLQRFIFESIVRSKITVTVAKLNTSNLLECKIDKCRDTPLLLKCLSGASKLQKLCIDNSYRGYIPSEELNTINIFKIFNCRDPASLLKGLSGAPKLETLRIDNIYGGFNAREESEERLSTMASMNNLKTIKLIDVVSPSQIQCLVGCAPQITDLYLVYNEDESDTPVNIALDLSRHKELHHLTFKSECRVTVSVAKVNTANLLKCEIDKCRDPATLLTCLSGAPKLQTLHIDEYEDDNCDDGEFSNMLPIPNLEIISLTSNSISQSLIQGLVGSASKLTNLRLKYKGPNRRTSILYLDFSHNEQLQKLTITRVCIAAVQLKKTNIRECTITGCVCTTTSILESLSGAPKLEQISIYDVGVFRCDCNKELQISDALSACLNSLVNVRSITLDFIIAKQVQVLHPELKNLRNVYIKECTMTSEEFRTFVDSIGHTSNRVEFELSDIGITSGEDTATTLEYIKSCPRFDSHWIRTSWEDKSKYHLGFSKIGNTVFLQDSKFLGVILDW